MYCRSVLYYSLPCPIRGRELPPPDQDSLKTGLLIFSTSVMFVSWDKSIFSSWNWVTISGSNFYFKYMPWSQAEDLLAINGSAIIRTPTPMNTLEIATRRKIKFHNLIHRAKRGLGSGRFSFKSSSNFCKTTEKKFRLQPNEECVEEVKQVICGSRFSRRLDIRAPSCQCFYSIQLWFVVNKCLFV